MATSLATDQTAKGNSSSGEHLSEETADFYRRTMRKLEQAGVRFLVGGAYAYARYTGIVRHTKDFDIFVHHRDFDQALDVLAKAGYQVERTFPHWLGKAYEGDAFVDLIFSSGNGIAEVDDLWFEKAVDEEVLGVPAKLCPAEEIIWSKSFIMERERFDGGDISHLIRSCAESLDWDRLLQRFAEHWRVLLTHLLLFGYIYPGEAHRIPARVMEDLLGRALGEVRDPSLLQGVEGLCRGTVLSRSQYLKDVEEWDYRDAREKPVGEMSAKDIEVWTEAAREEGVA
ncbi:MAG TPA: nucleotidyltransferase family protein [Thermoanaerobaculia bacterium]|nr:nucleotidyltransferase family protein [Thermoanaerobaculia bacterium]